MLRFTFDNDAIEHLVNRDTFEQHRQNIARVSDRQEVVVHFSRTNLLELIKGATERNFRRLQTLLRQAYALGGRHNMLLSPSHHLRWGLGRADQETLNQWYNDLYNDVFQMFKAANFQEFQALYSKAIASLNRGNVAILEKAMEVKQSAQGMPDSEKKEFADDFLSEKGSSLFFDLVYPSILEQFNLQDEVSGLDREEVVRRLPSLIQFCDVYRSLMRKRIIDGRIPKKGDYFDIQKVVYLDWCDYIVSDDRKFRVLLNEAGTSDLVGRAIPLSKFLEHIDKPFLLHRLTITGNGSAYSGRMQHLYE